MKTNSFILNILRKAYSRLGPPRTKADNYHNTIFSPQQGNDHIFNLINEGKPFLAGRIGSTELSVLENYIQLDYLRKNRSISSFVKQVQGYDEYWRESVKKNIQFYSGFFPSTDEMLERFSLTFLDNLTKVDVLGVWYNAFEDHIVREYSSKAFLTELTAIEPYYHQHPWSACLKGKRVLVVHPFTESISLQYAKRSLLFPDTEVLPDFFLILVKAVQTIAGSHSKFSTWFDALDHMLEEIRKHEFDIAIIGAGAYGLPLGAAIKDMGKQAVHLGGAAQVLFGIKGKRWDSHDVISSLYNQHWIRPLENERPQQFDKVEGGCYW